MIETRWRGRPNVPREKENRNRQYLDNNDSISHGEINLRGGVLPARLVVRARLSRKAESARSKRYASSQDLGVSAMHQTVGRRKR